VKRNCVSQSCSISGNSKSKTCKKYGKKCGGRLKRKGKEKDDYDQLIDGEPFAMAFGEKWKHKCCKCGLVHDIKVDKLKERNKSGFYAITFWRINGIRTKTK
jgi:hypothetical protein